MRVPVLVLLFGLGVAACGGDADASHDVGVPDGATFCSVFNGEYLEALQTSPVANPSAAEQLADWAEVLAVLAPDEIRRQANDNARYARDIAEGTTPTDSVVSGSNLFLDWAAENC